MAGDDNITFTNELLDRDIVVSRIENGDYMVIAGDESQLAGLPSGNWIAGTIPYFMSDRGGCVDQSQLFVSSVRGVSSNQMPRITLYDEKTISRVAKESPEHGFTILILPASSTVHLSYAQHAPDYPDMFFSPIVGWIAGVHLDQLGKQNPKIGFGPAAGMLSDSQAVAMHVPLNDTQTANLQIINLFEQGDGPTIRFTETGFSAAQCDVEGTQWNLSDYIKEHNVDTRLPLVADYSGVMINVSIQEVLDDKVNLYAPVFTDVEYRFAAPIDDYVLRFDHAVRKLGQDDKAALSCNCILNFLYSELEGKQTGTFTGPMTFGEVGYQLLNQTMVYLTLDSA